MNRTSIICAAVLAICSGACTGRSGDRTIVFADGQYTLSAGGWQATVSPETGGRIVSFRCGDEELLTDSTVHPVYYGATMWVSPQCDHWPVHPVLDRMPYRVTKNTDTLCLESEPDTIWGVRFIKRFFVSECDSAFCLCYTVENCSSAPKRIAVWDVARVHGGTGFFEKKDDIPDCPTSLRHLSEQYGCIWYHYSPDSLKRGEKLFATTRSGWLAYRSGSLLFVKTFPLVDRDDLPPMQGEAEIFVAPSGAYVELENHSAYILLPPGGRLHYPQKWFLFGGRDRFGETEPDWADFVRRLF